MVETLNIDVLMFVDGFYRYNISTDILPFTSYSFAVQSCNELGCSEFSDASEEIQTDEDCKSNIICTFTINIGSAVGTRSSIGSG